MDAQTSSLGCELGVDYAIDTTTGVDELGAISYDYGLTIDTKDQGLRIITSIPPETAPHSPTFIEHRGRAYKSGQLSATRSTNDCHAAHHTAEMRQNNDAAQDKPDEQGGESDR